MAIVALRDAIGIAGAIGEACVVRGLEGIVERSLERHLLIRLEGSLSGMLSLFSYDSGEGTTMQLVGYLFGADPATYVAREQQAWADWLGAATAELPADASSA
jgi:hypothetical protein